MRYSYLNWLCSSLRHNTNQLAHFSDDVKGCGAHITHHLRSTFYKIFNGIISQIKKAEETDEIKFLLNSLKWHFKAGEHEFLAKSGIMKVLREGNGQTDKSKNPIKFTWGHSFSYKNQEDIPLPQEVLNIFEQVMLATYARIMQKDSGEKTKLKEAGTSIPKIEKAHSVVNVNHA